MFNLIKSLFGKNVEAKPSSVVYLPPAAMSTHVVKDTRTHLILTRGTKEECDAYRQSFRMCYVDEA